MTMEPARPPARRGSLVLRALAGVVSAVAGLVFLFATWMALSSRFGWDDRDVHGYGLIFGTFLAILAGFVVALALPLAFGPERRGRLFAASMAAFGVTFILLIVALVTA